MDTADSFLTLSCPNCGGKLDVYPDMDRFGCSYCGTEIVTQRRGGTVGLKAVAEAIQKVQAGTDRAAAELALVRLEKVRQELREQQEAFASAHDRRVGTSALFGSLGALIGAIILFQNEQREMILFGCSLLVFGLFALWTAVTRKPPGELSEVSQKIQAIDSRIADQRKIVDE